jgi:Tfp pilus assembly protein PilF
VLMGDAVGALSSLKKAAALDPKAAEPHLILADAYVSLGRSTDAARERALAKRLGAASEE